MDHAERIRVLTNAVCTAKNQFEHYAELHDRKGTTDGAEKAKVNRDLAKQMGDALAQAGSTDR